MHNPTHEEQLADFAASLQPRLAGELRIDRMSRALYATDASMYQVEPLGVLIPRHEDDVLATITEAARFGVTVLPRGSGSSLAGSAVGAALVIDTTRFLDRVLEIRPEDAAARVQPGVVLDHLNGALSEHGLMVGPDPASSNRATIGGMVGTNATGTHSIRYGSMVDHVRSIDAVLPGGDKVSLSATEDALWDDPRSGRGPEADLVRKLAAILERRADTIARDTPGHWRRAGGYRVEHLLDRGSRNLASLFCGSEGTLGFVSEVELGLVERPTRTALGVAHFPTRKAALEAVVPILETDPSAIELFDRVALHRAREVEEYRPKLHFVQGDPAALLIVEYTGESTGDLQAGLDALARVLGTSGVLTRCDLDTQIRDVWDVRKVGLGLSMSARLPVQCLPFIEDAAVPVERLAEYIGRLEDVLREHGTEVVMYAHASAGCLHVRPFLDIRQKSELAKMREIAASSADLVKEFGGIISSEHGDGLARSWLAPSFYGQDLYDTYVEVKQVFDPENRFNPGRVVRAPSMTENLRVEHPLQVIPLRTEMDWRPLGGLATAVEACNGQGVCRKRLSGTMCPSFMVTRDEKDSTRGRANALRNVFSGVLSEADLHSDEMQSVMDLCISCKACRSECPASVDMASMKAEWLSMRWQKESPPLRTRMIAHQPGTSKRLAGRLARASNAALQSGAAEKVLRRIGFGSRALPPFSSTPFNEREVHPTAGEDVILFADTWARFHEPEVARSAVEVLRLGGFNPIVPAYACCGRTLISKGFLKDARTKIRGLVDVLHPLLAGGAPLVGLEPSCILTLRDEAPRLLSDDDRVPTVTAATLTFEEFVAAHETRFRSRASSEGVRALLHAHCHQKALSGVSPGIRSLEVAGFQVDALDAGCCGMAGSFGYEAEHEEVSIAMAERILAPAVRAASSDVLIVASGTSCRHQIKDCTGRDAVHPAVALSQQLGNQPRGRGN